MPGRCCGFGDRVHEPKREFGCRVLACGSVDRRFRQIGVFQLNYPHLCRHVSGQPRSDKADAIPDGFPTADALRQELSTIYGEKLAAGYQAYRVVFRVTGEKSNGEC